MGAQLLRSAHQSLSLCAAFNGGLTIVFPECFVGSKPPTSDNVSSRLRFCKMPVCRDSPWPNVLRDEPETADPATKELPMLYALLAYHVENEVNSWTPEEDAALMVDLHQVHDRLHQQGRLGPAARLGATGKARTLRGPGAGTVIDGPFAETKEQLLGLYVIDCASEDAAVEAARDLRRVNPTAVYEIRPVQLYLPGVPFPVTEAASDAG
jgi:hypothetical protein